MVTILGPIIPLRSIMLSHGLKLPQDLDQGLRSNNKSGLSVCFQDEAPAQSYSTIHAESKNDNTAREEAKNKLNRWIWEEQIPEDKKAYEE